MCVMHRGSAGASRPLQVEARQTCGVVPRRKDTKSRVRNDVVDAITTKFPVKVAMLPIYARLIQWRCENQVKKRHTCRVGSNKVEINFCLGNL